jgi:hypothetical protein
MPPSGRLASDVRRSLPRICVVRFGIRRPYGSERPDELQTTNRSEQTTAKEDRLLRPQFCIRDPDPDRMGRGSGPYDYNSDAGNRTDGPRQPVREAVTVCEETRACRMPF